MHCRVCQSASSRSFNSEINIHFPGLRGLDKPTVLVFPELVVCLDCGFTEFEVEEAELPLLAEKGGEGVVA